MFLWSEWGSPLPHRVLLSTHPLHLGLFPLPIKRPWAALLTYFS